MSYPRVAGVLSVALTMALAQPAGAQLINLPVAIRAAIAAMGPNVDPGIINKTEGLMRPLQASRSGLSTHIDVAYGPHALQKLDVYTGPDGAARTTPIVVFVHGGRFEHGDKGDGANIAAYFARHNLVGVTINYRLAPSVTWPEQAIDIGNAISWLRANADRYGGDPQRIIAIGHSSGAAVIASYLLDGSIDTVRDGVVGAVLISGVYGYETRAPVYYGADPPSAVERQPRSHIDKGSLPFLIVTAEYDPPWPAADSHHLAAAICMRDGQCPPFLWLSGHNHISEIESIDTSDDRLGNAIGGFVQAVAK
jgi:acetyl esterase/lipase